MTKACSQQIRLRRVGRARDEAAVVRNLSVGEPVLWGFGFLME